jgi:hypothetical protein
MTTEPSDAAKRDEPEKSEFTSSELAARRLSSTFTDTWYILAGKRTVKIMLGEVVGGDYDEEWMVAVTMPMLTARRLAKSILELTEEYIKKSEAAPEEKKE